MVLDHDGVIVVVNTAWSTWTPGNRLARSAEGTPYVPGQHYFALCEAVDGKDRDTAIALVDGIRTVQAGRSPQFVLAYPGGGPDDVRRFVARVTVFRASGRRYALVVHQDETA